jgi:hypothetical protein
MQHVGGTKNRKVANVKMQQNHANRWGVLKIEKQQMQLLTPYACLNHANILKVQDMNSTHENLHSGCIEQMITNAICLVGSWSWVPALQCFCIMFLHKPPCVKVLRGGCWISFSFCICSAAFFLKAAISLQNLFKLTSEAM